MNTNKDKELKELKDKTKKSLDQIIRQKFPKKILELNEMIEKTFNIENMKTLTTTVNIPIPDNTNDRTQESKPPVNTGLDKRVFLFPNGLNESNEQIVKLCQILKPLVLEFVWDMRSLKFAIQLMVPKVEDGHNFGVAIQETVIKKISRYEESARTRFAQFGRYFNYRGCVVCWIARWPHSDDYRRCLQEEDQKFYLILCLIVRELRDGYISVNDLILKNLDKIKNPKPIRENTIY